MDRYPRLVLSYRLMIILIVSLLVLATAGVAQQSHAASWHGSLFTSSPSDTASPAIEYLGGIGGFIQSITINNGLAYVGEGSLLSVFDISSPAYPGRIGTVRLGRSIVRLVVQGNRAFAVGYSSFSWEELRYTLYIVDVSNPQHPALLGSYLTRKVGSIQVVSNLVYLGVDTPGFQKSFQIVDVSDPTNPTLRGSLQTKSYVADLQVVENLAYLAAGSAGLQIVNVVDPAHPTLRGSYPITGFVTNIQVIESLVYLTTATSDSAPGGLQIVDVHDPDHPILIGNYRAQGINNFQLVGNLAYFITADEERQTGAMHIVDVSDPAHLTLRGTYTAISYIYSLAVVGDVAYLRVGYDRNATMQIVDVRDPSQPAFQGSYSTSASTIQVVGSYAYLSDVGLQIVDVSDSAHPTLRGSYSTIGETGNFDVVGNFAYIEGERVGLQVLDLSDPANPALRGEYPVSGRLIDSTVIGHFAFLILLDDESNASMRIVDFSDPSRPELRWSYLTDNYFASFRVVGNIAYLGVNPKIESSGFPTLHIIDVSDPTQPVMVGSYSTGAIGQSITNFRIVGKLAYISSRVSGENKGSVLQIVDLSDQAHPRLRGTYTTGAYIGELQIVDNLAVIDLFYCASKGCFSDALDIVDLSDPTHPTRRGSFPTPRFVSDLQVIGKLAYLIASGTIYDPDPFPTSLQIVDLSDPTQPTLRSSYPVLGGPIQIVGNLAYLNGRRGLEVVDVSNPASPISRARLDGFYTNNIQIIGDVAYANEYQLGFHILRIYPERFSQPVFLPVVNR